MNPTYNQESESKKNIQAGSYTALVVGLMLCIFFFVKWGMPPLPEPPVEEGLEVNLGNSDAGLGNDQPYEPGEPAPANVQETYAPPKAEPAKEDVKDIETDDKDVDAPEIKKPPIVKPEATKVPEKEVVKSKPVKNPKPVETPVPPAPRPKAQMGAINGTGTGGNEASTYKKGGSEGIAGGRGDQGRPGGDPDSKSYSGGGKGSGSGIGIRSGLGNRKVTRWPGFTDDFNENGKVVVAVKFGSNGSVLSVEIVQRGTTGGGQLQDIAKRKARELKLNVDADAPDEQIVTFEMNFKLTN